MRWTERQRAMLREMGVPAFWPVEPTEQVLDLYNIITLLCDEWFGAIRMTEDVPNRTQAVFCASILNAREKITVRAASGRQDDMDLLLDWYDNSTRSIQGAMIGSRRHLLNYLCKQMLGAELTEAKMSQLLNLGERTLIALAELVLLEKQPLEEALALAEMEPVYDLAGRPVGLALP